MGDHPPAPPTPSPSLSSPSAWPTPRHPCPCLAAGPAAASRRYDKDGAVSKRIPLKPKTTA